MKIFDEKGFFTTEGFANAIHSVLMGQEFSKELMEKCEIEKVCLPIAPYKTKDTDFEIMGRLEFRTNYGKRKGIDLTMYIEEYDEFDEEYIKTDLCTFSSASTSKEVFRNMGTLLAEYILVAQELFDDNKSEIT